MGIKTKTILKGYFNVGDTPSENNFIDVIDSFAILSSSTDNTSFLTVPNYISSSRLHLDNNLSSSVHSANMGILHYAGSPLTQYFGINHTASGAPTLNSSNFIIDSSNIWIKTPGNSGKVNIGVWDNSVLKGLTVQLNKINITDNFHITGSFNLSSSQDIIGRTGSFDYMDSFDTQFAGITSNSHITASGNISASGNIIANNFTSTGGNSGGINFNDGVIITGSITASNTISSSGDIIGITGSFDVLEADFVLGSKIIRTKTSDTTLAIADKGTYNRCGSHRITLPLNSSVEFPIGTEIDLIQTSSTGHLMVTASAGLVLNSRHALLSASGQFSAISCIKIGTNEWDIIGDLTK